MFLSAVVVVFAKCLIASVYVGLLVCRVVCVLCHRHVWIAASALGVVCGGVLSGDGREAWVLVGFFCFLCVVSDVFSGGVLTRFWLFAGLGDLGCFCVMFF